MLFTSSERRLLALLSLLLGSGYAVTALCHFGLLPAAWCRGDDAPERSAASGFGETAASPECDWVGGEFAPAPAPAGTPDAPPSHTPVASSAAPEMPPAVAALFRDGFLDLNCADSAALCALPGIGPTLASRILAQRRQRPFARIEELLEVRGIGPRKLEQLQRLLIAGGQGPGGAQRADSGAARSP